MKKVLILLLLLLFTLVLSGCSNEEKEEIAPTVEQKAVVVEETPVIEENKSIIEDTLNEIKFNSNLNDFEEKWLVYLEEKNPNSKIFHIKTKDINCNDCYEVSYKKDRTIIKIKVLNNEKKQETTTFDDLVTEIENTDVCSLFSGMWNECPSLCNTDEKRCATVCGPAVCEFDEDLIVYNKVGEVCGAEKGDCEFGFTCYFNGEVDRYGTCK